MLDRFRPRLAPWTRCPACNGLLAPVAKAAVAPVLPPGTRRTYQTFSRCRNELGLRDVRLGHGWVANPGAAIGRYTLEVITLTWGVPEVDSAAREPHFRMYPTNV